MTKQESSHISYLAKSYKEIYIEKLIALVGEPERLDLLQSIAWKGAIEAVYIRLHKRSRQIDRNQPVQLDLFK